MLWIKALHIIFTVTWFAGLFYLPRLFVYHAMANDTTSIDRFKIMERKLFFGIMTPGGILAILFGVWLLMYLPDYLNANWMLIKLGLVVLLILYHIWCGVLLKHFKENQVRHSHIWFRWFNEVPVLALIAIVILVVVKPFAH